MVRVTFPRLAAVDIDDTLLGHDLTIHPRNRRALAELMARGCTVTLATGRMYQSARPFAEELGLGDVPLICYNGGLCVTASRREILWHEPLPAAAAAEALAYLAAGGWHVQAYEDDRLFVAGYNPVVEMYCRTARVEAEVVGDLRAHPWGALTKLLVIGDPDRLPGLAEAIAGLAGGALAAVRSWGTFLEIGPAGVNKGTALRRLAARLGVAMNATAAFGDSENDREMLAVAGLGVAMACAPEAVKAVADHTAPPDAEAGLGAAIEQLVLGVPG